MASDFGTWVGLNTLALVVFPLLEPPTFQAITFGVWRPWGRVLPPMTNALRMPYSGTQPRGDRVTQGELAGYHQPQRNRIHYRSYQRPPTDTNSLITAPDSGGWKPRGKLQHPSFVRPPRGCCWKKEVLSIIHTHSNNLTTNYLLFHFFLIPRYFIPTHSYSN